MFYLFPTLQPHFHLKLSCFINLNMHFIFALFILSNGISHVYILICVSHYGNHYDKQITAPVANKQLSLIVLSQFDELQATD